MYVGGESEQWVSDALKEAKNKNMLVVDMMDVLKERIKEEEHVEGMKFTTKMKMKVNMMNMFGFHLLMHMKWFAIYQMKYKNSDSCPQKNI